MASVTSLGIHKPCALPYLIAESILPHDPTDDQYEWHTTESSYGGEHLSEELLTTQHCVVWSQGGIIQRVFRSEVENEAVVQAVLTWFPTEDTRNGTGRLQKTHKTPIATANPLPKDRHDHGKATRSSSSSELGSSTRSDAGDDIFRDHHDFRPGPNSGHFARALVVILKTQAHIYFLSGTSHVLHLPFEVDSVLPTPRGLLLQRKIPTEPAALASPKRQSVPPNSFASPQTQRWTPQVSQSALHSIACALSSPESMQNAPVPAVVSKPEQADANANLPRLFSLTDTMSELGLVVEAPKSFLGDIRTRTPSFESLSHDEEIIYVSKRDELRLNDSSFLHSPSLLLAVTSNKQTGLHTLWSLSYIDPRSVSKRTRTRKHTTSDTISRRRSSYGVTGAGTGVSTPIGRGPVSTRESFGMDPRIALSSRV